MIFVGDDWSEAHHDVEVQDETGRRLARARLPEGVAGIDAFHELVAARAGTPGDVVVGIETDRGLWVQALVAAGYRVHAINPFAASRYRDRHSPSGAKSDAGDAAVLASVVRTDRRHHRLVAGDTALAEGVKVLARAQQNLIWSRQREARRLRALLREFYPAALVAFEDLTSSDALAVLAVAPSPTAAAKLTAKRIAAALRAGGRRRGADAKAAELLDALYSDQLRAPPDIESASSAVVVALVGVLRAMSDQLDGLEGALAAHFEKHPDAELLCGLPGLGAVLGARMLAEFGDDPTRYADARAHGTTPAPLRSPARRGAATSCSLASPATTASSTPATGGRSTPSTPRPAPGPTTTIGVLGARPTTRPPEPSPTASSASSTAASGRATPTTRRAPGRPPRGPTRTPLDDCERVMSSACRARESVISLRMAT